MSEKRVLVVYFSRSGNTHRVAEALAAKLQAEIEEVTEPQDRSALTGIGLIAGCGTAGALLTLWESRLRSASSSSVT